MIQKEFAYHLRKRNGFDLNLFLQVLFWERTGPGYNLYFIYIPLTDLVPAAFI